MTDKSSWIARFCGSQGNGLFCDVEKTFIQDTCNLKGLCEHVSHYKQALERVLDADPCAELENPNRSDLHDHVEQAAKKLYGLIHARYILTSGGVEKMSKKYQDGNFGCCPRVYCDSQCLIPLGLTDAPGKAMVKLYCPKCSDIYKPKSSRQRHIDGAYFGTEFTHTLLAAHPEFKPKRPTTQFVPRLLGFKIHPLAYELQQNSHNDS